MCRRNTFNFKALRNISKICKTIFIDFFKKPINFIWIKIEIRNWNRYQHIHGTSLLHFTSQSIHFLGEFFGLDGYWRIFLADAIVICMIIFFCFSLFILVRFVKNLAKNLSSVNLPSSSTSCCNNQRKEGAKSLCHLIFSKNKQIEIFWNIGYCLPIISN